MRIEVGDTRSAGVIVCAISERKGLRLSEPRADDQGPERLELGLGVLDQRDAHVLCLGLEEVLVVTGTVLPALQDLIERRLAGADVLGRELGVVAGALDAIPRVRAVGAVVRDAVPLREIVGVCPRGGGQLGIELERLQALGLAVAVDCFARYFGVEDGPGIVAIVEGTLGCAFGGGGGLARRVEAGDALAIGGLGWGAGCEVAAESRPGECG